MDLDALRAFIALADTGSFSQAARSVDWALSTLKKRVDELETSNGVELLRRAADGVRMTRAGELLADKGRAVLRESKTVIDAVRALELSNKLITIELPLGLPPTVEQVAHRTFRKAVPSLRFRVRYNTGTFDPTTDASFVLHLGPVAKRTEASEGGAHSDSQPPPSMDGWLHTRVAKMNIGLAASKSYLDAHGTPQTLDALLGHDLLVWERVGIDPMLLPCQSRPEGLKIVPVLVSPSANLIRRFAQADDGIAFLPSSRVLRFVDEKDPLVRVLEREVVDHFELWMAVHSSDRTGSLGALGQALARLIKSMYVAPA